MVLRNSFGVLPANAFCRAKRRGEWRSCQRVIGLVEQCAKSLIGVLDATTLPDNEQRYADPRQYFDVECCLAPGSVPQCYAITQQVYIFHLTVLCWRWRKLTGWPDVSGMMI